MRPGLPYETPQHGCPPRFARTFDRDDRLAFADAASDAGKSPRIAERFQVKQDHVGAGIFFPMLQQVIAGHIGPLPTLTQLEMPRP